LSSANYNFATVDATMTVASLPAITLGPETLPAATVGDFYTQHGFGPSVLGLTPA
jgi:hypothetical protein